MVDVQSFVKSMKISWLKRLMATEALWARLALEELPIMHSISTSKCMHGMNQTETEYSRLARGPKEQL